MCEACQTLGVFLVGGGATVAVSAIGVACHLTKKKLKKNIDKTKK